MEVQVKTLLELNREKTDLIDCIDWILDTDVGWFWVDVQAEIHSHVDNLFIQLELIGSLMAEARWNCKNLITL